jgi:organic radical activating enzyme
VRLALAERFKAPQGEGLYAGTQMAFLRTVGCSVGKKICTACDTDFDAVHEKLGGGLYSAEELVAWVRPCTHVCLTGGEPLDRDLRPLLFALREAGCLVHIETSGTKRPDWLLVHGGKGVHTVAHGDPSPVLGLRDWREMPLWITVSPKPGYRADMITAADELKVIIGGLGDGPGWPGIDDALAWAARGKLVYVQPRNGVLEIDRKALSEVLKVVETYPQLRLSVQLHKFVRTR